MNNNLDAAMDAVNRRKRLKPISISETGEKLTRIHDPRVQQMATEIIEMIDDDKLPQQWEGHMRLLDKAQRGRPLTRSERDLITGYYITHDIFHMYWGTQANASKNPAR